MPKARSQDRAFFVSRPAGDWTVSAWLLKLGSEGRQEPGTCCSRWFRLGTGMSSQRLAKKLLLIGWDGADWQIIKPLLERGEMPALQSLIEHGVMGNMASMRPMISPMLWTTMATGKSPYHHGIHGFSEPDPNSETGIRLVCRASR